MTDWWVFGAVVGFGLVYCWQLTIDREKRDKNTERLDRGLTAIEYAVNKASELTNSIGDYSKENLDRNFDALDRRLARIEEAIRGD